MLHISHCIAILRNGYCKVLLRLTISSPPARGRTDKETNGRDIDVGFLMLDIDVGFRMVSQLDALADLEAQLAHRPTVGTSLAAHTSEVPSAGEEAGGLADAKEEVRSAPCCFLAYWVVLRLHRLLLLFYLFMCSYLPLGPTVF